MGKVLGMGNALVDVLTQIEHDSMLELLCLPKGSMQLVSSDVSASISAKIIHLATQQASGGSAANTIHGLANLGVETGFLGKVGNDELGHFFRDDMKKHHINPVLLESASATGRALALISPDTERTFATFLGAACELSASDLKPELFDGYTHFHIEGYLVQNKELIRKALELAKAKGLIVSLDLASFNVVEQNLDFLKEVTEKYVDILFANEEEAKAFTGATDQEALTQMGKMCNIAVLKLGAKGSMIMQNNQTAIVGVIPVNSIDTTGAGDLYAAGFLYGLLNLKDLETCGNIGAILSGHVIEVIGPKMTPDKWSTIKTKIGAL